MIHVTASKKKQPKPPITTHPSLVTDGRQVFLTIPVNKDTALRYSSWERDAVVLVGSEKEPAGTFIQALNLEMCELYEGFVKIENDK